jgi:hypothetical protein
MAMGKRPQGRPRRHVAQEGVRMPPGARVVLAGADTVWLTVQGLLPEGVAVALDTCKETAQERQEAVPSSWVFRDEWLMVEPYGAGKGAWRWVLRSPSLTLNVGLGKRGPICRARVSAEYLWKVGLDVAISHADHFLREMFGGSVVISLSELHLCADIAGVTPGDFSEQGFISRSHRWVKELPEQQGADGMLAPETQVQIWCRRVSGYAFSRGAAHSCAIYDKVLEIRQQSPDKVWFFDLWRAGGWDGKAPITRIEFRYTRDFLREFGLTDHYDVLDRLADLWAYSAGAWLRYCVPSTDPNRARWVVHPLWQVIQAARFDALPSCPVVRSRKRQMALGRAVAAVAGYASSVSAWLGGPYASRQVDVSLVFHWLCDQAAAYLAERGRAFGSVVLDKRQRFGLPVVGVAVA